MKVLLALFGLLITFGAQAESWPFALIGDVPYSDSERRELPFMLDNIAAEQPAFIVHAGDFKRSSAQCSDQTFLDRHALFDASKVPFIYVPGDNEWTDCQRVITGHFSELERLNKLRELFFAKPLSLGKTRIPVEQQSAAYPEHLRWRLGKVLFVSLNVPGFGNNFGMSTEPGPEFLARNPIVIDWLKQGFAAAKQEKAAGMVIVMQANPGFKHFAIGLAHSGFRELLEVLRDETLAFPGKVLLVHGDTHWQRIDQPLYHPVTREQITRFTRIETFGYPFMGWVKVIIDSENPALFRFELRPYKTEHISSKLRYLR